MPELDTWPKNLARALHSSDKPAIVVAHSFGCLAAVHCAAYKSRHIAGALLVAPADPGKFMLDKQLQDIKLPFPSILIGSENDPWMKSTRALFWANQWGSHFINGGEVGHINADSRLDDWLYGLSQLQRLALQLYFPADYTRFQ